MVTAKSNEAGKKPRYFERPERGEKPLTFLETLGIILSSHLGVRTREKREEDFRRANGLHVFFGAILYFVVLIIGLIVLVRYISDK